MTCDNCGKKYDPEWEWHKQLAIGKCEVFKVEQ